MSKAIEAISTEEFQATECGLVITGEPSYSEWAGYGKALGRVGKAWQFCLGDWLNYGEHAYGQKYTQAAAETGLDEGTLMNAAWVAREVEISRRREILSFSHHAEVAKLAAPAQEEWLEKAEKKEWSVREFRWQLKAAGGAGAKAFGPIYVDNDGVDFGFWALSRPLTGTWGSGDVWNRMCAELGETPDVAFGRTDNIPEAVVAIDRKTGYEWASMPQFTDGQFRLGYWDPPYDHLYKAEAQEIWRTCRKLAILHTHVYPRAWLAGAKRKGMYAITMGPMKQMRCLQVFEKANGDSSAPVDD